MQRSRRVPALDLAHPGWVFAATTFAILIGDQITKAFARYSLQLAHPVPFIPGLVRLEMVHNTGAAFGLFQGGRPVFVLTSLLVLFVIAAYWRRARPTQWPVVIALAMIAGGSLGNLIDRALVGKVTDFFEFTFVDFPVFNVADMGIVGGVALLMVWVLFGPQSAETVDAIDGELADATGSPDTAVAPEAGDETAAVGHAMPAHAKVAEPPAAQPRAEQLPEAPRPSVASISDPSDEQDSVQ